MEQLGEEVMKEMEEQLNGTRMVQIFERTV